MSDTADAPRQTRPFRHRRRPLALADDLAAVADDDLAGLPADAIARTAVNVRVADATERERAVHKVAARDYSPDAGHTYRTSCQRVLSAGQGTVLTARDITCSTCQSPERSA